MPNQYATCPSASDLAPLLTEFIDRRLSVPMMRHELQEKHGLTMSLKTVQRRLRELELKIRTQLSALEQRELVLEEIRKGAKGVGLQTIQNRIYREHKTIVGTHTIRNTILSCAKSRSEQNGHSETADQSPLAAM